jgi:hypothetical protein
MGMNRPTLRPSRMITGDIFQNRFRGMNLSQTKSYRIAI